MGLILRRKQYQDNPCRGGACLLPHNKWCLGLHVLTASFFGANTSCLAFWNYSASTFGSQAGSVPIQWLWRLQCISTLRAGNPTPCGSKPRAPRTARARALHMLLSREPKTGHQDPCARTGNNDLSWLASLCFWPAPRSHAPHSPWCLARLRAPRCPHPLLHHPGLLAMAMGEMEARGRAGSALHLWFAWAGLAA